MKIGVVVQRKRSKTVKNLRILDHKSAMNLCKYKMFSLHVTFYTAVYVFPIIGRYMFILVL